MKNYAVIDIGSNSVRYMGARGQKLLTTTRLAEDLAETGRLSEAAIERSLAAIGAFVRRARIEGLTPRAYATSAVRDAQNADSFLACLREKFGLRRMCSAALARPATRRLARGLCTAAS